MSYHAIRAALIVVSVLTHDSLAQSDIEFKPYKDNQCKTSITPTFDSPAAPSVTMDPSQDGWPNAAGFLNATFPGAQNNASAGSIVYWQIPEPGVDCRYVLMQDWPANGDYGDIGVPQGYGMTVLDVGQQGCSYSSFPDGNQDFFWSFCCGGDCSNYAANDTNLVRKRDKGDGPADLGVYAEENVPPDTSTGMAVALLEARNGASPGSPASRARAAVHEELSSRTEELEVRSSSFDWSKCSVVSKEGPRISSGQQVMVGSPQNCPSSTSTGCSFSAVKGTTNAVSLMTERTQTITNSVDLSVSFMAELNLLVEEDSVTTTAAWGISFAVAKSTSQTITNTTTFSFTNQLTQYPGTNGFVSWIPSYQCWSVTVNCGGGNSQPLNLCTTGNDQGSYQLVVTD